MTPTSAPHVTTALLREHLGDALRRHRLRQGRTLREVSQQSLVSLAYLSEIERGRKEASSELLAAVCEALDVPLSTLLMEVSDQIALAELSARTPIAAAEVETRGLARQLHLRRDTDDGTGRPDPTVSLAGAPA